MFEEETMKRILKQEIEYNKNKLKNKLHLLQSRQSENTLLKVVMSDYESYYTKLKEKEESHQNELNYIYNYLKDIIDTNDLTDHGLDKLKQEQNKIVHNLQSIKEKINSI